MRARYGKGRRIGQVAPAQWQTMAEAPAGSHAAVVAAVFVNVAGHLLAVGPVLAVALVIVVAAVFVVVATVLCWRLRTDGAS